MKRLASGDVVQWWADCADVFGRDRTMWIGLTPTSILMAVPPGEVAVLSAEQASELAKVLTLAVAAWNLMDMAAARSRRERPL